MRDLLLLAIIVGGSLYALKRPWIGVMMWTWVSLMNPHEQFGWYSAQWPVASIVAVCTMLGLLFTRDRQNPFQGAPAWTLLAFIGWICVTLPLSIYFNDSLPLWIRSMKIFLMTFVTLALLTTRQRIDSYVWVIVGSLGFYGLKGGVFTLATGGNYRVWGPGGFIGGNNELALALVMTIPLMRYLQQRASHRWLRLALGLTMLLTAITVLGSYSRGALVAISVMLLFMWWKGDRKIVLGLALVAAVPVILSLMPEAWWSRMDTIGNYEQDASAMGRINAWKMAWNLALDRSFGGGFMVSTGPVFQTYAPDPTDVHAAHSIYFQVLGEHGFVGLLLFVAIGASTWMAARRLVRDFASIPGAKWAADLGTMVQVSMLGYAAGGAFLSLAYFDLPYDLVSVIVAVGLVCRRAAVAVSGATPGVPALAQRPGDSPA